MSIHLYQIITITDFYYEEPVISQRLFSTFEKAKNYVLSQIDKLKKDKQILEEEGDIEISDLDKIIRVRIPYNNGANIYKLEHLYVDPRNFNYDFLDEFCVDEAKHRLVNIFEIPEDQITEDLLGDTYEVIRDIMDNDENLYDTMDDKIREVLRDRLIW